eukprot:gene9087-6533_t
MAAVPPIKKTEEVAEEVAYLDFRITLTSRKVAALEKLCADLKTRAVAVNDPQVKVKGPVRMPTKVLRLMVRKSPCGEGTNTFDRWQMRIHKRIIDVTAPADLMKKLTNITIEPGIDIEVDYKNAQN